MKIKSNPKLYASKAWNRRISDSSVVYKTKDQKSSDALKGAAIGGVASLALMKDTRSKLADLRTKSNKSEEDLKEIKRLRRKLATGTIAGTLGGAALGYKW